MNEPDSLFLRAQEMDDPVERADLLAEACASSPEILARVEALLADEKNAESYFAEMNTDAN